MDKIDRDVFYLEYLAISMDIDGRFLSQEEVDDRRESADRQLKELTARWNAGQTR